MTMDEGASRARTGYSAAKYGRLVAMKDKFDPDNLFSVNENIKPSGNSEAMSYNVHTVILRNGLIALAALTVGLYIGFPSRRSRVRDRRPLFSSCC